VPAVQDVQLDNILEQVAHGTVHILHVFTLNIYPVTQFVQLVPVNEHVEHGAVQTAHELAVLL
jgi:hypothetical protein